jgi:hypothetical protein
MDPGDPPRRFTPDELGRILEAATASETRVRVIVDGAKGFSSGRRTSAIRRAEELIELMTGGPVSIGTAEDP